MKKYFYENSTIIKSDHIKKNSNPFIIFALVLSITIIVVPMQESFAVTNVDWQNTAGGSIAGGDFNDENFYGPNPGIVIFVHDDIYDVGGGSDTGANDQISITITTTVETVSITLPEVGGNTGDFAARIAFLNGEHRFDINDKVIVTVNEPNCLPPAFTFGNCDAGGIDTIDSRFVGGPFPPTGVTITSDTQGLFGGIGLLLTETGVNTGIFSQTLSFSAATNDETTATLQANPGDIIHLVDDVSLNLELAVITPFTPGVAGIRAVTPSVVTASYDNGVDPIDQDALNLVDGNGPGRGGGGPSPPGLVVDSAPTVGSGGSDSNPPPTIGISKTGIQIVDHGFFHNSDKYEITDTFWTPFDKVQIDVGMPQFFGMKGTGVHEITRVEFALVPGVGMIHKPEVVIEAWIQPGQERVVIKQKENIIDENAISPELIIRGEDCFEGSGKKDCIFVGVSNIIFREEPFFEVVGLKIVDTKGRDSIIYLNDGFDIVGESMNPPKTDLIGFEKKGLQELKQVDKWKNIWEDEEGIQYFKNEFGTYVRLTPIEMQIKQDEYWTVIDRMNNNFEKIVNYEKSKAKKIFDSDVIITELPESFAYAEPDYRDRFQDENFVRKMHEQADLATQYWDGNTIQGKLRDALTTYVPEN